MQVVCLSYPPSACNHEMIVTYLNVPPTGFYHMHVSDVLRSWKKLQKPHPITAFILVKTKLPLHSKHHIVLVDILLYHNFGLSCVLICSNTCWLESCPPLRMAMLKRNVMKNHPARDPKQCCEWKCDKGTPSEEHTHCMRAHI